MDQTNLATVSHGTLVTSICQGGVAEKSNPLFSQQESKRSVKPSRTNFYSMKKLNHTGQAANHLVGIVEEQTNNTCTPYVN
jgi:hypothetical protein